MRRRSVISCVAIALVALGFARERVLSASQAAAGAKLTAISSTADGHRAAVLIESSEPVAYLTSQPDASTVVVDLRNVSSAGYANGFVPTPGSPIRAVAVEDVGSGPDHVSRVKVTLDRPVKPNVRSQRNLIFVEVDNATAPASAAADAPTAKSAKKKPADKPGADTVQYTGLSAATGVEPPDALSALGAEAPAARRKGQAAPAPAPAPKPAPPATTPAPQPQAPASAADQTVSRTGEKIYTGHPVSLDFQGADLRAVLRTFAEISGLNIVIDPTVQGSVDVALRDVPWDQALDIILRANKLGYFVDGTIVRVAPLNVLAEEEKQRRKLAEEQALSGELRVMTKTLSYARAEDLKPLLIKSALTQRGTVEFDPRTNTLIISDLPLALETATKLIDSLDKPQPQVEIEARIVQTTSTFARTIGVNWGIAGRADAALGNTTNLAFPNNGSLTGRTGGTQGPNGVPSVVDLATGAATSAIGLALGSVNGAFNIDVALSALEKAGQGKVLSSPRVSTQNNVEAEITQGVQIPIQTIANNTVTVTFKDAALTLKVTPQITSANTVIMRISVENASPDFSRAVGESRIPPIDTQRALTQVLVSDGQTTVIGGIYVSREQTTQDRTPGLYRVPLLGWLFKRDSVEDEKRELLIFITPRILHL